MSNGFEGKRFQNWAETFECHPQKYFEPDSFDQVKDILKLAIDNKKKLKIVGCGHSPSNIACTNDYMVSLNKLNRILDIDTNNLQVKVEAGARLDRLNNILYDNGMAFSVLGSISYQTVGGILCTGHHGTGIEFGNFNSYIVELEMLLANGEIRTFSKEKNSEYFSAVLCSLGCLGIIMNVKIQCEKAFKLEQIEYSAKLEDVLQSLNVHVKSCDHFRAFWYPHTEMVMCYKTSRTNDEITVRKSNWLKDIFVGYYLLEFLYWIGTFVPQIIPSINKAYFRLFSNRKKFVEKSFNVFNFNCLFKQYAYEAAIPIKEAPFYLLKLKAWLDNNPQVKVHFGVEIRFVKSDDIWLSPCYQQDSCYLNILMFKPYGKNYDREDWWNINKELAKECNGRPHWAKSHTMKMVDFEKLYPKFNEFNAIRKELDPKKIFFNEYLEQIFS